MDKIYIRDLEVYAFHGCNEEEKSMGQKFLISAELFLDLSKAGESDDLTKTVNYGELCEKLEEEFKKNKYNLIEKCAEELSKYILKNYDIVKRVKLMIKKPWAPIRKLLDHVAVEIDRSWHRAYIGVGSNLGDREGNIENAIKKINESGVTKVTKESLKYETKPVGYLNQDNFINCALEIKTLLTPEKLIKLLLSVEKELKRERVIKWGPRTIDLDVLLYDDIVTSSEDVIVPHPRMHERMFVLKPLSDIAPYVIHPILNERIYAIAEKLNNDIKHREIKKD